MLFELTENKLAKVEMFWLGWDGVERRGSGEGDYLRGRKGWLVSARISCLILFCRLVWLIGGCGNLIHHKVIRLNLLIFM